MVGRLWLQPLACTLCSPSPNEKKGKNSVSNENSINLERGISMHLELPCTSQRDLLSLSNDVYIEGCLGGVGFVFVFVF